MANDPRVIVALDYPSADAALALADQLDPSQCRLKVGKELFTSAGPEVVKALHARGFGVFLDLKFHDIPNTVAGAVSVAANLGVWMVNVHALGGRKMMQAAHEARQGSPTLLTAVTVLTSHSAGDLAEIGLGSDPQAAVSALAALAMDAGLDGLVCSAQEARMLRQQLGPRPLLVTPGIRPAGSAAGDQSRVMTPVEALQSGVNYLVIGRPITQADNPASVLRTINADIADC
ncbi:MAG: orotidine-5'-phosphate decarboxylase [Gammaproteobacteria bacterium]|nr:MAG: orotidine-5'-phosphate decarboxylase [Gammaproteobacteria bacterium]